MNYRQRIAEIRSQRERDIEEVRATARRRLADAAAERDDEIRRLDAAGLSTSAIAARIGYSRAQVYELLADKRSEYNERRREHWRLIQGGDAA